MRLVRASRAPDYKSLSWRTATHQDSTCSPVTPAVRLTVLQIHAYDMRQSAARCRHAFRAPTGKAPAQDDQTTP